MEPPTAAVPEVRQAKGVGHGHLKCLSHGRTESSEIPKWPRLGFQILPVARYREGCQSTPDRAPWKSLAFDKLQLRRICCCLPDCHGGRRSKICFVILKDRTGTNELQLSSAVIQEVFKFLSFLG